MRRPRAIASKIAIGDARAVAGEFRRLYDGVRASAPISRWLRSAAAHSHQQVFPFGIPAVEPLNGNCMAVASWLLAAELLESALRNLELESSTRTVYLSFLT